MSDFKNIIMKSMKRYILTITILSLMAGAISSCGEYFTPGTEDLQSEQDNFKTYNTSRATVNGLYTQLQDLMDPYVVLGELRGDMLTVSSQAGEDLQAIHQMEYSPDNDYFPRREAFQLISGCNDVLGHFSELLGKGTTYDEKIRHMRAEVKVMRAWTYFFLMRTYQQVPYITSDYAEANAGEPFEDWLASHGSDPATIVKLIGSVEGVIQDFDPTKVNKPGFFNLASGYALLGELYLWDNQYNQAAVALEEAIRVGNGERYILDSDLEEESWGNIFKGDETANDEIITKVLFNKGEKQENQLLTLFSSVAPNGRQLVPADDAEHIFQSDYRRAVTFYDENSEVSKYTRNREHGYQSDMPVILYRAADLHLMLAEAYNRMHDFNTALELVNNGCDSLFTPASKGVRGRLSLGELSVDGSTTQEKMLDLEEKILQERARELAYEGNRWFDILRIAERRSSPSMMVEMMKDKYPEESHAEVESFYQDPANWYLPFK